MNKKIIPHKNPQIIHQKNEIKEKKMHYKMSFDFSKSNLRELKSFNFYIFHISYSLFSRIEKRSNNYKISQQTKR